MKLFGKGSKMYSIMRMRCPRCQEGEFFTSSPYDLKNAGNTHEHCPKCNLKYSREPGFYYGAMYVAYALGVALFVTFWASFNLFFPQLGVGWQVGIISFVSIVAAPYNYALSKIIWANFFIRFEKKEEEKVTSSEAVSGS